jgi:hypothetical protein
MRKKIQKFLLKEIVKSPPHLFFFGKQGFGKSFDESFFLLLLSIIFVSDTNKARGNTAKSF